MYPAPVCTLHSPGERYLQDDARDAMLVSARVLSGGPEVRK